MNPSTLSSESNIRQPHLVLMWRGNILAPNIPTNHAERFRPLITALSSAGIAVSTHAYFDAEAELARALLLKSDGVLVWINPLQDGQDRRQVDRLLRDVSSAGIWVSAHPDTIAKMGVKEVLYATRSLGWGSDTELYRTSEDLASRLPANLANGPRVLKPLRGNDGKGVLKVARLDGGGGLVRVQAASDDCVVDMLLPALLEALEQYFADGACVIDQAFNDNAAAGMVRCYMSRDRVAGFAEQTPRAAGDVSAPQFAMNSAKAMHGADAEKFAGLRESMEQHWTPGLMRLLNLSRLDLPVLWDADFLHRAPPLDGRSPYVLCEINVSSVSPFPDAAIPAIVANVQKNLSDRVR